ncbi:DUF2570 domain-containing protein [Citrobacter koseri]|uniref:DUF2570 domain-containing protein n=1 Tax=Citrobacter koseri TaxID=545 RepID=UPI0018FFE1A7|nr:DUF2570 domain-containing protein [Citrobacter koseri]MBJ9102973.1 DUF2570 domain-containing protein [Citrobacter koseri]
MTSGDKAIVFLILGLGLFTGYVWRQSVLTQSENEQLTRDLQIQTQARNTAEWLLHGQEQTMQVFSAIRAANRAARLIDENQRNEAKQTISAATAQDDCGDRLVPSAAADELRRLEQYARAPGGHFSAD